MTWVDFAFMSVGDSLLHVLLHPSLKCMVKSTRFSVNGRPYSLQFSQQKLVLYSTKYDIFAPPVEEIHVHVFTL